jgi:transcriptional/translational regulatory protein YebC/TACO1
MAEPGAVSWQFERKGVIGVATSVAEDDLMGIVLDAGADDLNDDGDQWILTCEPVGLHALEEALMKAKITPTFAEVQLVPTTTIAVPEEPTARKVLHLMELLEDHDDVQNVYANFDIPDEILEKVDA